MCFFTGVVSSMFLLFLNFDVCLSKSGGGTLQAQSTQ